MSAGKKVEKILLAAGIIVIIFLAVLIVWQSDRIGVSKAGLEKDAREKQEIEDDWKMAQDVNEDLCAMLFYDEDQDEYVYSVYLSHEGMSFGYFYRQGGTDEYIRESVKGIVYEDKGIALMSMNHDKVCRIQVESPEGEKNIQVDPAKPFALVLPSECGEITMYDASENIVVLYDAYTG